MSSVGGALGLMVPESGYDRRRAARHHRIREADQVAFKSRRLALGLPAVDIILDDGIRRLYEKMGAATFAAQRRRARFPFPFARVHRERRQLIPDLTDLAGLTALAELFEAPRCLGEHPRHVLGTRQASAGNFQKRDCDIGEIDAGKLEHRPIDVRRDELVTRFSFAFRSREDQRLRTDDRDGQTTDTLLPEGGTSGLVHVPRRHAQGGGTQLAFGAQRKPSLLEIILRHAEPVVPQDEEILAPEVVDLDVPRVCIMRVLEELAYRRRNAGYLLPPEHVDGPCSYAERSHQRRFSFWYLR